MINKPNSKIYPQDSSGNLSVFKTHYARSLTKIGCLLAVQSSVTMLK